MTRLPFCLYVNIFVSSVYPEKTVNIMSLVVWYFDCFENEIVKELGVCKD